MILKKNKENLLEIKDKFKKEFIYHHQDMIEVIEFFIKKIELQDLDLFFMEKWKLAKNVYKNLINNVESYKQNLKKIKEIIDKVKKMNWSDEDINGIVKTLVGVNLDNTNLNKILLNYPENFKEIIISLNEFLFAFANNEIEAVKGSLDSLIDYLNKKENFYMKNIKKCFNHTHYDETRKYSPLCWTTIKVVEENIYFDFDTKI